jgi:hypothetical protein
MSGTHFQIERGRCSLVLALRNLLNKDLSTVMTCSPSDFAAVIQESNIEQNPQLVGAHGHNRSKQHNQSGFVSCKNQQFADPGRCESCEKLQTAPIPVQISSSLSLKAQSHFNPKIIRATQSDNSR